MRSPGSWLCTRPAATAVSGSASVAPRRVGRAKAQRTPYASWGEPTKFGQHTGEDSAGHTTFS